jgi:phosphonate transport system ATP-binding protein
VYDGPASGLNAGVLTRIYGEEDWTKTSQTENDEPDDRPVLHTAGLPVEAAP